MTTALDAIVRGLHMTGLTAGGTIPAPEHDTPTAIPALSDALDGLDVDATGYNAATALLDALHDAGLRVVAAEPRTLVDAEPGPAMVRSFLASLAGDGWRLVRTGAIVSHAPVAAGDLAYVLDADREGLVEGARSDIDYAAGTIQ